MTALSVVGLGAMGSRIAKRLLARGHTVSVWSRDESKVDDLVRGGAVALRSPSDAARRSAAVIVMVTDGAALGAVTEGVAGVLAGRGPTVLVQMSTVAPDDVARLAAAMPPGWDLLDTPVLGSRAEAESGTLKILAGAPLELFERWAPLLSELGAPTHYGPVGAGTAAKLVANSTLFGVLGVLGESLALAAALGLPVEAAAQVLAATPLAGEVDRRLAAVRDGGYPPRFALSLARKDADLMMAASASAGADLRLAPAVRSWLADAESAGWGEYDYTAVLGRILGTGVA